MVARRVRTRAWKIGGDCKECNLKRTSDGLYKDCLSEKVEVIWAVKSLDDWRPAMGAQSLS